MKGHKEGTKKPHEYVKRWHVNVSKEKVAHRAKKLQQMKRIQQMLGTKKTREERLATTKKHWMRGLGHSSPLKVDSQLSLGVSHGFSLRPRVRGNPSDIAKMTAAATTARTKKQNKRRDGGGGRFRLGHSNKQRYATTFTIPPPVACRAGLRPGHLKTFNTSSKTSSSSSTRHHHPYRSLIPMRNSPLYTYIQEGDKDVVHASDELKGDTDVVPVVTAVAQNSYALENAQLSNENKQLRTQLTNHESIFGELIGYVPIIGPGLNGDTNQEETMPRPLHSSSSSSSVNNKKRKHTSIKQIVQNERKKMKIKVATEVEKANVSIQSELEMAQDTNGYLIRFQDKQMTQIDELKQQIKDLKDQVSRH